MDTSKIVGEKIKALREDKSISIEELAQRSGLALEQVERIENNIDIMPLGIKEQIKNIEDYVEQVLYYSKINDVNKDYIVKNVNLELVVKNVIRKNASDFIHDKLSY